MASSAPPPTASAFPRRWCSIPVGTVGPRRRISSPVYRRAAGQDTPHHAADGAFHGLTVYGPGDITGLDLVTDVQYPGEDAVRRGAEHALTGVAADEAGDV